MALADGLVGYWSPWLGSSGYRLLDRTGRGNHGTLTNMDAGTDWVGATIQGRSGYALDFDNTNDVVSVPHLSYLDSGHFTISCWYFTPTVSGFNQIVAQWQAVGAPGPIAFRNGAAIAWQIQNRATTANILTANSWHFLSFICGPSLRVICNGVLDSNSAVVGVQSNSEPFLIGGPVLSAGTGAGNCRIADVVIHTRALTVAEHVDLYVRGPGCYQPYQRKRYGFVGGVTFNRRRRILCGDYS